MFVPRMPYVVAESYWKAGRRVGKCLERPIQAPAEREWHVASLVLFDCFFGRPARLNPSKFLSTGSC